jgi:hypothetical protein
MNNNGILLGEKVGVLKDIFELAKIKNIRRDVVKPVMNYRFT